MSKAKSGDKVRIHYTGKLDDGTQFDSSAGREPLEFDLGGGGVIPGFDSAVDGMAVGESKSVKIESKEAYGPRHEELIQDVPKSELPDDIELSIGLQLQAQNPEGQVMRFMIAAVTEEVITLDGNHPLAGQNLNFDIELVEIVE
ncbi:MAG: peptidylprolyl isomerase [Gammaproteobacteria bacterium]|jgi:peptidylprolyl isomerase|nr:peptidylprolyl isomerase [Gammaproteobacteria bacterium]